MSLSSISQYLNLFWFVYTALSDWLKMLCQKLLCFCLSSLSLSLATFWSRDFKFVRGLFWVFSEKLANVMQDTRLLQNWNSFIFINYLISTTKIYIYSIFTVHSPTALDISKLHERASASFLSLKPIIDVKWDLPCNDCFPLYKEWRPVLFWTSELGAMEHTMCYHVIKNFVIMHRHEGFKLWIRQF